MKISIKSAAKGLMLSTMLSSSAIVSAASFDFAAIANTGEYGAPSITFTNDGLSVTATGSDTNDSSKIYNAYLDSSWNHRNGGGDGGLGVCKELNNSTDKQCNPGSDDNVTINENLKLDFGSQLVTISQLIFRNGEHNPSFATDAKFDLIIDGAASVQYALVHSFTAPLTGKTFEFLNVNSTDKDNYRFYISAMEVNAVPIPAAVWLFGSGLMGLIGLTRKKA